VVAGVVALAGCGGSGSSTVSKAQYIKQADAICSREHAQVSALTAPSFTPAAATKQDMPTAARYLDRYVPLFGGAISQLDKLKRPSRDRAVLDRTLARADALVSAYDSARKAAHKGDVPGFKAGFAKAAVAGRSARALARRYGFQACGR
jgi:hypothetical protein